LIVCAILINFVAVKFAKAQALIAELREHPRTGTGRPEPLACNHFQL
jgi:Txe/YoeB family toxin of Txe-Axe toxin-antitoxin module